MILFSGIILLIICIFHTMTTPENTNTFQDTLLPTNIKYPRSTDFPFKSTDFPSPRSDNTPLNSQLPSLPISSLPPNNEPSLLDLHAIGITDSSGDMLDDCIGVLLLLIGVGVVAVWYIYMIKSLCDISYRDQKDLCPGSNAWLYLLFSISVFMNVYGILNMWFDASSRKAHLVGNAILLVATTGWGCVELFGVSCINELYNTLLYLMLTATVFLNLVNTAVIIMFLLMT